MTRESGYDPEHFQQHEGAYAAGEKYEPDMAGNQPLVIFSYVVVLSAAFFLSLGALYVYFKWEAAAELERKVYSKETTELKTLRDEESAALQNVEQAMKQLAGEAGQR